MEFENSENRTHVIDKSNLFNAKVSRTDDLYSIVPENPDAPAFMLVQINDKSGNRIIASRLESYTYDPKVSYWKFGSNWRLHVNPAPVKRRKRRAKAEPEVKPEAKPVDPPKPKPKAKAKAKAKAPAKAKAKAKAKAPAKASPTPKVTKS